jgi:hypothetical protein
MTSPRFYMDVSGRTFSTLRKKGLNVRTRRIKEQGRAYYHVISRVVDRRFVFDDDEKEHCPKLFSCVVGCATSVTVP